MNLIKSEINEKRPVYYFGSSDDGGHAFVLMGIMKRIWFMSIGDGVE